MKPAEKIFTAWSGKFLSTEAFVFLEVVICLPKGLWMSALTGKLSKPCTTEFNGGFLT